MKNTSFRFVLLLDFAGDFEDEDDDENEKDCASGYFSHSLFTALQCRSLPGESTTLYSLCDFRPGGSRVMKA